jgi:hypothetical protein
VAALLATFGVLAGCGSEEARSSSKDEPVRRASFRSLASRDFLASCPGAAVRPETDYLAAHHAELKRLAAYTEAGQAIALGENEWAGLSRYSERERCAAGEEAYRRALAAYRGTLDVLAARIAEYPTDQARPRP